VSGHEFPLVVPRRFQCFLYEIPHDLHDLTHLGTIDYRFRPVLRDRYVIIHVTFCLANSRFTLFSYCFDLPTSSRMDSSNTAWLFCELCRSVFGHHRSDSVGRPVCAEHVRIRCRNASCIPNQIHLSQKPQPAWLSKVTESNKAN
jgi:hypothetical protein